MVWEGGAARLLPIPIAGNGTARGCPAQGHGCPAHFVLYGAHGTVSIRVWALGTLQDARGTMPSGAVSLREIEAGLSSHQARLYHLRIGAVRRSKSRFSFPYEANLCSRIYRPFYVRVATTRAETPMGGRNLSAVLTSNRNTVVSAPFNHPALISFSLATRILSARIKRRAARIGRKSR